MTTRYRKLLILAPLALLAGCGKKEDTTTTDPTSVKSDSTKSQKPLIDKKNGPANMKDQEDK